MNAKVEPLISPLPMQDASVDIWHTKYQLKTKSGEAVDKTIAETYERVARALSSVEPEEKQEQKPSKVKAVVIGKFKRDGKVVDVGSQVDVCV